jgi:hypothetical protein
VPRVNKVEKARKAIPSIGVVPGDSYFWWTFKNQTGPGTKVVSKTYPKPSQLTRSNFKSQWRGFQEEIAELALDETLSDALQDIASRIRELGEECQSSLDNMPEGLQQGATGEMLQERIDNCESWASDIENLDEVTREEAEHPTFEEFLDNDATPQPNNNGELVEWAYIYWENYQSDCAERQREADEEYESKLSDTRDEAINADPGEV